MFHALVFGCRAGVSAARYAKEVRHVTSTGTTTPFSTTDYTTGTRRPAEALALLRDIMWNHCGPIRTRDGLMQALEKIDGLVTEGVRCGEARELGTAIAVTNCLWTARTIAESALARRESIGAHYRED